VRQCAPGASCGRAMVWECGVVDVSPEPGPMRCGAAVPCRLLLDVVGPSQTCLRSQPRLSCRVLVDVLETWTYACLPWPPVPAAYLAGHLVDVVVAT
jgi:hypothetical protein